MKQILSPLIAILSGGILISGCASTPEPPPERTVEVTRANKSVEAMVEVQAMRDEIARLRNELEIQSNEMGKLKRRQRELYDDLDYRLRAREGGGGANTGSVTYAPTARSNTGSMMGTNVDPNLDSSASTQYGSTATGLSTTTPTTTDLSVGSATGAGSSADLSVSQTQILGATQGMSTQSATPESGGVTTTDIAVGAAAATAATGASIPGSVPTQGTVSTTEEQIAYEAAFDLLKQSRYNESVAAFQELVITYPNGALADDAQYWIGEAMYVTRDFQGALRSFQHVVTRYPESQRVPEAMLKLGYIQYDVGAKDDARRTLTEVVNRYPGSRVAISAQTRLRKLQSEGG